jgi:hypothetical protein
VTDPSTSTAGDQSHGRLYRSTGAEGPQAEEARPAVAKRRAAAPTDWSDVSAPLPVAPSTNKVTRVRPALTVPGLIVLDVVVVTIAALINVALTNHISLLTSVVFVICAILGALFVRKEDPHPAWIIPPLGYFTAVLIAGQFILQPNKSLIVSEASMIGQTLGFNSWWIIGGTLAAFIIVMVRSRR